ncbi:MAG: RNA-binding protein [Crenarchaeota archaeon]|nr:RNA-binding protein [Thermoproteota archaeon]
MFDIIVKVPKEMEKIAASYIEDLLREHGIDCKIIVNTDRWLGIVFISNLGDRKFEAAELIKKNIPEASHVLVVYKIVPARLEDICNAVREVALQVLRPGETFAIRTNRRGKHDFTSVDVNVLAGKAVQEATGAEVDLECPSKAIYVEIFDDIAAICVVPGEEEYRKLSPGKPLPLPILRKMVIVQMPYTGPLEACRKMGERIGRAVQTFEIGELYVAHYRPVNARELVSFLEGVLEGIESRYSIQKRCYGRPVHKVPVQVYDLFQYVREHRDEPIIVTDPKGEYIMHVKDKLAEIFQKHDKVHILVGAREGIPVGIFRFATLVIDLIPQITISTDYAITSTVIGLISALEETGILEKYVTRYMKKRGAKNTS